MGCFSWMFADEPDKNLKMGRTKTFYLPLPDERIIRCSYYDGYGRINGIDVKNDKIYQNVDLYALLALWNRKELVNNFSHTKLLNSVLYRDIDNVDQIVDMFYDTENVSDQQLEDILTLSEEETGYNSEDFTEIIRLFGIHLDCDCKNLMKYPIKISLSPCSYSFLPKSEDDPNQGGYDYYDYDEEDEDEENE